MLFCLITLSTALSLAEASGPLASDIYIAFFGPIIWVENLMGLVGMTLLLVGFGLGLPTVATAPVAGEAAVNPAN